MLDDSEGSEDEPISANGDSWNSERAEPGGNVRTPISGTLTDPELLDCPICFLPLASPVYQVSVCFFLYFHVTLFGFLCSFLWILRGML